MRKVICNGCGLSEDLDNPTHSIHLVQLIDLAPDYGERPESRPDKKIEEDLCKGCRQKIRRDYFGESDAELLEMPLMKGA